MSTRHPGAGTGPWADVRVGEVGILRDEAVLGTTPLTVLAGEPGCGRGTVLDKLAEELTPSAKVLVVRLAELDRTLPYGVIFRLLVLLGGDRAEEEPARRSVLAMLARAGETTPTPETVAKIATAVFALLRVQTPLVVLVDDAQWLDEHTARLVSALLHRCTAETPISVVATVRIGAGDDLSVSPALKGAFARLVASGRAKLRFLRPLSRAQSRSLLTGLVSALPNDGLVSELHTAARGNPAALTALVRGYRAAGALRIVDRTAYRVERVDQPVATEEHPLLLAVTEAGGGVREVAETMAVLCPLGTAAPGLAATALGWREDDLRAVLDRLVAERVLVREHDGGHRFRVPAVRDALLTKIGPYASRSLAAQAVQAVWSGSGSASDPDVVLDWITQAGSLVDTSRASRELLENGKRVLFTDGAKAERWLHATLSWVTEPPARTVVLMLLSAAKALHYRAAEAGDCARQVLCKHLGHLEPAEAQELSVVFISGLAARGDLGELAEIAAGASPVLPDDPALMVINRAYALVLSHRWIEARDLLERARAVWTGSNDITADFGMIFLAACGVVLGDTSQLQALIAHPELWRAAHLPQYRIEQRRFEVEMLLQLGELRQARRLITEAGMSMDQLPGPNLFALNYLGGDWPEAMELARRTILGGTDPARPLHCLLTQCAIRILGAQGRLSRARALAADSRPAGIRHTIDLAESSVLGKLGDTEGADALLYSAARSADAGGYLLGTEDLWADLARSALARNKQREGEHWVRRSARTATQLDTARAHQNHYLARAAVHREPASARRAAAIARERLDVPYESAMTLLRAGLAGHRPEQSWTEAYELFGEVDAWYWRGRVRKLLRDNGFAGPGRTETTAENERLLAILVAEGLTNRQLAVVLETSEKSVEGRLSRLFSRTGYTSRVELAAAILTGEYLT
ncbi:AAA family ATPase [Amycolatopsis roodepoortensis]|uniref:ATP-binding protein n=1 Tax=Amycolatopsis roodepoortensis TaxID=700274 RepID=UPI00214C677D|nr:AAA family ATPase [Amycolatopsis roodepoortensis]UUV33297.1 AAA family ATPase [Amycolatopsis roodepoortensis]